MQKGSVKAACLGVSEYKILSQIYSGKFTTLMDALISVSDVYLECLY